MPTREQKQASLQELKEKFGTSQVAVMANYRGLNVAAMTKLRVRLRERGAELKVVKNTLALIAARENGIEGLEELLTGPTAIAFSGDDLVAPAKVMLEFARESKIMEVKGGLLEGKIIDAQGVKSLADLPPREVLLAQVLGGMQAPLYGFAGALQGLLRNLVYVLEAIRKQKAGETA
ncbi:MAG: 50S ribosomal protein L10 [Bacillota bacterium]|uniref:50S ribosomal protein L10 n=1 Tax=Desulfurispora thermophila TaxID=265470 RepID=UPI00035D950B|nr:50S ribosomal protein L10 [Desulfurispora thermophila]